MKKLPREAYGTVIGIVLLMCAEVVGSVPLLLTGSAVTAVFALISPAQSVPLILIAAAALIPFAGDVIGETGTHRSVSVSLTDVLILMSLPGVLPLLRQKWQKRKASLPRPIFLYAAASAAYCALCALSFLLNRHAMMGGVVTYAAGWVRVVQMLCVVPATFACVDWTPERLSRLWMGFLVSVLVVMVTAVVRYGIGLGGEPVFRTHKNILGLAIAAGVLIALVSHWSSRNAPLVRAWISKIILVVGMPALAAASSRIAVLSFLTGLLYLAIRRSKVKLPLLLTAVLVGSLFLARVVKPADARGAEMTVSMQDPSVQERILQYRQSMARFWHSPVWGDGLRARKDIEPHNLEILLLAETGMVGLAAFGFLLWTVGNLFRRASLCLQPESVQRKSLEAFALCTAVVLIHAQADPFWRKGPLFLMGIGIGIGAAWLRDAYVNQDDAPSAVGTILAD